MLMIFPFFCSIITLATAWAQKKEPLRMVFMTGSQSSSPSSRASLITMVPALLTKMSILPISSLVSCTILRISSTLLTSHSIAKDFLPSALISFATFSRAVRVRLATTRSAPASARAKAIPRPRPRDPPVTMATLFSRFIFEKLIFSSMTCPSHVFHNRVRSRNPSCLLPSNQEKAAS